MTNRKPHDGVLNLEDLPVRDLLGACQKLGEVWGLGNEEMANLLGTSQATWIRWLKEVDSSREPRWTLDQRTRALVLLRIFEAIGDLHQADEDARAWPREPFGAPRFGGRSPLDVMQSGFEGLLLVRDYLNFVVRG